MALGAILGLLLSIYVALRVGARPAPPHPWFAPRPGEHSPLVVAHQGGEELWPSNTMLAFEEAVALGADVIDSDMHLTADGVAVLMHDETVDRTTDGRGAIRDMTLAQLHVLDAGYHFTRNGGTTTPYRGEGLRVPTVEELFERFPDHRFGIEIKQADPERAAAVLCTLIREHGVEEQLLVSSFRQPPMDAFRRACPEVATSATEDEVRWFYVLHRLGLDELVSPGYQALQIPEESAGFRLLTPSFVAAAHRRGVAVIPWTIDEPDDLRRISAMEVDGINTNRPDRLIELLEKGP